MDVVRSVLNKLYRSMAVESVVLKALNALPEIKANPLPNSDDELAVPLVQAGGEDMGLIVDGFWPQNSMLRA